ncbi:hypothetical protein WCD74_29520 [Actinomycetospora sp. OC33-EN08]|uniref:Uncharacterized protein n=1 Tax=Actinomycetospora aurantiaca TaxID=3129233 RepID=A0ABU8MXN2_9PSEU
MTTTSDPVPLFDLVTGFPPDDATDVTLMLPTSLALFMTMLESTGRASEVAVLRRIHIEQARETARRLQGLVGVLVGSDGTADRLRVTHIVEDRNRPINGLRPHVHFFVGSTTRGPDNRPSRPIDVAELALRVAAEVLPDHRHRIVAATAEQCGLAWGPTPWSPAEVLDPAWLAERAAELRDESPCPGPWPRNQVLPDQDGRTNSPSA